jgi:K+-sensing histidine kinase KdpD
VAAIPIIVFDSGFVSRLEGALLNPPIELFSASQIAFYAGCKSGWSICPLGYCVYSEFDGLDRKFVVPGIYPPEGPSPKRKFPNYPLRFSKLQIQKFADSHLNVSNKIREQRDIEFKNLTHDLRGISTEIYHTALNLKSELESENLRHVIDKVSSVLDAQQMMSLRLDIVDYESGLSSGRPPEVIAPYRKIDKVKNSFRNRSRATNISIKLEGWLNLTIFGPPIFEIIPFVIIENAFKYSPSGSEILIKVEQNLEKMEIIIRFDSYGPKIRENERKKIFERNYRGIDVSDMHKSGSGIGLFAASTIVETHFSGAVFVNQFEDKIQQDSTDYYKTRFTVIIPASADDPNAPRSRARRHTK